MALTIMAVLDAAYNGERIYFQVLSPGLYFSPKDLSAGGLGWLFRLFPALLGSMRLFGTEKAVRASFYPGGYANAVVRQMKCPVWDGAPRYSYCRYSLDADVLLDYPVHRNQHAQPTPSCPGYDAIAPTATELVALRVAQCSSETRTSPPMQIVLDSGGDDTP